MRLLLKIALPFFLIAVAGFGYYALVQSKPQTPRVEAPEKSWIVESVDARVIDIQPDLHLYGEVVAGRKVELRPFVAGRIVAVGENFREGGIVSKGDLLVAVDPFDYQAIVDERMAERNEARARLREIRAEYDGVKALLALDRSQVVIRRREVTRREKLRGSGVSSVKALDDARLALSENEQRLAERERAVKTWKAKLAQQDAAIARIDVALRRAQRDLEQTRLLAPYDGFVLGVQAEIGKRLGIGDKVAELIDANRLEVRFHISNAQFARLGQAGGYRGRIAKIDWDGGEGPLKARLQRESGEIETASGGVNLYASLEDIDADDGLRPGAFVRVTLPGPKYSKVIRLPESVLYGGNTVYTIVDNRLAARTTALIGRLGSDILVRGGIKDGDAVLTTRIPEVGDGVLVSVQ